ncbi:MAG: GNAT family N-acetyltransferase [Bacilli bacterium]|nr:GNAT family N-acetyltransferase [Bacilli bacterium]
MKHLGTVTLESERLILRKCKESDYKDSYKYCCSDPELCRLQGFDVHKSDETTRRSFKEKEEQYKVDDMFYEWAIIRKKDNQFMGEIALVHYNEENNAIELGYHLGKVFRGQGYMQEALNRILSFAFEELDLNQVYALILNDNTSSSKVAKSNNLEYSTTIERYKDNVYKGPIDKYEITKEKWFKLNSKKKVL